MSGGSNRSHNRRNPPDLTRFSDNEPYSSTSSDDLGPDLEKSFLAASSEESSVVSTRRKLQRRRRQGSQTVGRLITPPLESSESNQGQSASMVTPRRRTSASRGSRSAPVSMRERMPMSTRTTSAYGIGPIPFQDTSNARPDRQSSRTPRKQRASGMRGQGTLISPPQSPRREREMTPATVFTNLSDEQSTRSGSSRVLGAFVGFATEVVATTLKIVRKPLGVIVALYILIVIMSSAGNYIADTVFAVLSPLCYIPGVAALNIIPYCKYVMVDSEGDETRAGKGRKHRLWTGRYVAPDYPQLINLQSEFEEILGHSAMGYALALSMKNAEISIRDLSTLVRVSKLICK